MTEMTRDMEQGLLTLLRWDLDTGIDLEEGDYQKVNFRVYSETIIEEMLRQFKFKTVGNVYDFPERLPQPDLIDGYDMSNNFDFFQKIAVSKKFNSIAFYTIDRYSISCTFLVDTDKIKKFSKGVKPILQQDSRANMFRDTDFTCKDGEFVEVSDVTGDQMKPAEVVKKTVAKEKLVFDEGATIVDVMRDIVTFFKKDTEELYAKMDIAYKRGIILFGDPGNGKSAMIREIIRQIPSISKVVINPNVSNMPRILASLLQALKGKQAIIIIEDLDSLVTSRNRSEFLNLLDGVDISSGIYLIGTTNYPDRVDPAIMNRSGRFDRTYKIENPSEATRRAFFESRKVDELLEEYDVWKDENKGNKPEDIIELFVKNSHDLPMASLKEVMTGTKYLLATSPDDLSVEEAVETTYQVLTKNKEEHKEAHEARLNSRQRGGYDYDEY
jgi:hypothetical protein